MKKKLIIPLIIIFIIIVPIVVSLVVNFKKGNNLIKTINIEEGCYTSQDDKEHLICFTRNHKFYSVLNKYGNYYNDINYYIPPRDDASYGKYDFSFEYDKDYISLSVNTDGDNADLLMKCNVKNPQTLNCTLESTSAGVTDTDYRLYTKVDKEFNEESIKKLQVFNRTKEYSIDFNGEKISCNLTWLYSVVNTAAGTSAVKQCLEKNFGEDFIIGIPTDSETKWLIKSNSQKIAFDKKFPGATLTSSNSKEAMKYNNETFGYNVTASIGSSEEISFGIYDSFPYDPYDEKYKEEKMIIKITNNANTHISTIPEQSKLQYNKKYALDIPDNPYYSYYNFLDNKYVEYVYNEWYHKYPYEQNDNQIIIKPGYPNKDVYCNILSDTIIHCDDSPYCDYIIH